MFKVQILCDETWKDLSYLGEALTWDQAVTRFTFYMNSWIDNDYRIVSA